jgi:hypothetical protein
MIKSGLITTEKRREFIARIVADMGKTILGIDLASYFFERFQWPLRVVLTMAGPTLLVWSVLIEPREKKGGLS